MRVRVVAAALVTVALAGCVPQTAPDVRAESLYGEWVGRSVLNRSAMPCESSLSLGGDRTMTAHGFPADLSSGFVSMEATGTWELIRRDGDPFLNVNLTEVGSARGLVQQLRFVDEGESVEMQLVIGAADNPDQVCRFRRTAG